MSGISLSLNPHRREIFSSWDKGAPISLAVSEKFSAHLRSSPWTKPGSVFKSSACQGTMMNQRAKTMTSETGKNRCKKSCSWTALLKGRLLWEWGLQDKWAILKAVYLLSGPHIIHQWTICLITSAVCKSEAGSLVRHCKNKSTHILAWHRQQKASWNITCSRRIKASLFRGTATWRWQSKYLGLTV